MEINGDDGFRIRSYQRAAEAIEASPDRSLPCSASPRSCWQVPGIGKGMAANIKELCETGTLKQHQELLQKYRPTMLELLKIQGLGRKPSP